jgi:hypothetical protein
LECHRFSMISAYLSKNGFIIKHILKDGSLRENSDIEKKMMQKFEKKLPKPSLFKQTFTSQELFNIAYELLNKEVAYSQKDK